MYHKLTIEETLKALDVNPETGLSDREARGRAAKESDKNGETSVAKFLRDAAFRPSIYVLLAAVCLAAVFRETAMAFSMLFITVAHIIFSAVYRLRGESALADAVTTSVTHAIVLRNGAKMKLKSDELVVGDVVTIKPGRVIPADIRLISSENLVTDESALTGFNHCEKDCNAVIDSDIDASERVNCAFGGTVVIKGRGDGVVIATGMSTEMSMLTLPLDVPEKNVAPTAKKLQKSSKLISSVILAFALVIFFIGFIRKDGLMLNILTVTALVAATVPYDVHSVVSGILSRGAKTLKRFGFFVKSAADIEALGGVSVLITDIPKMGVAATYTNGKISTPAEEDTVPFLDGLLLCNFKNPSLRKFAESKCDSEKIIMLFPRTGELSGEITTTLHRAGTSTISYSGGEVWDIINRSDRIWDSGKVRTLSPSDREDIDEAVRTLLEEGYSLTALGMRFGDEEPCDTELIFLGIAATCAEEDIETNVNTKELQRAGVRVYLLTEEDAEKARLGAEAISLGCESLICGREVNHLSDEELAKRLSDTFVFAGLRVRDKVRIINILKSRGKTVAAIGDGISDAPVLEAADVGISGVHARDVAKDASGILLDGTTLPEEAVLCGKLTRSNIKKATTYFFATGFALIACIFSGVVLGFGFPVSPTQILLLNFIGDALCVALIAKSERVPAKFSGKGVYISCILAGIISAAIFKIFLSNGLAFETAQWYTSGILCAVFGIILLPLCFLGRKINGKRN